MNSKPRLSWFQYNRSFVVNPQLWLSSLLTVLCFICGSRPQTVFKFDWKCLEYSADWKKCHKVKFNCIASQDFCRCRTLHLSYFFADTWLFLGFFSRCHYRNEDRPARRQGGGWSAVERWSRACQTRAGTKNGIENPRRKISRVFSVDAARPQAGGDFRALVSLSVSA